MQTASGSLPDGGAKSELKLLEIEARDRNAPGLKFFSSPPSPPLLLPAGSLFLLVLMHISSMTEMVIPRGSRALYAEAYADSQWIASRRRCKK